MTPIEKSKLIDELFSLRKADQGLMESERKRMETERKRLDDLLDSFQVVNVELRTLRVQLSDLLNQLAAKDAENASLREELKLSRKNLYGKKSRHGCSSKKKDSVSREESKDDFDGTSGYLPCCGEEPSPSGEVAPASAASPKEVRLYRIGMDYRRMTLSNWLAKGSVFVNKLVDVLKEKCLDKDAVLNRDETWCRVKVEDTYRKRYICSVVYARAKFKNDGRYSIDNSLAERFIRPLAGERKNSIFFGSNRMAEVSAAYHTRSYPLAGCMVYLRLSS